MGKKPEIRFSEAMADFDKSLAGCASAAQLSAVRALLTKVGADAARGVDLSELKDACPPEMALEARDFGKRVAAEIAYRGEGWASKAIGTAFAEHMPKTFAAKAAEPAPAAPKEAPKGHK
jgi:hypothetical protein